MEDCLFYDTMTAESGKWEKKNNPTVTIDSGGTTITTSTDGEKYYFMKNVSFTLPYTVEFTWVGGSGNQQYGIACPPIGNGNWYCSHGEGNRDNTGNNNFVISTYPSSTSSGKTIVTRNKDISSGDVIKILVETDKVTLYQNNVEILSKYQGKLVSSEQYIVFYTNKNRSQKVNNVKFKHYSE